MRISIKWLSDLIDLAGVDVPQLTQALTDIGLEVESVESQSTLAKEIVVGEILTASRHPNADQLQVCSVSLGHGEPLTIVCGAPNARVGIKVAVAQVGAVLPGDFKIKKSKIRGENSSGMLCSEKELELSAEHQGIIELPADTALGIPLVQALGLGDAILEVKVTPNRADCLSYLGVARDLAAKLGKSVREPVVLGEVSQTSPHEALAAPDAVKIEIHNDAECGRFVGLVVQGIKVKPSPEWLQRRLVAAGMRPINQIVDATNYVMLEWGQPSHAYDLRAVQGRQLGIKSLTEPATLKTLDGQERLLASGDLVIVDRDGVIGLAGVMGGASSEVRDDTTDVVIEVAGFSRTMVRKTSKRLGLQSEASYRFERGTDIEALVKVAYRVAALIVGEGTEREGRVGPLTDVFPTKGSPRVVALRLSFVRQMLPQSPPLTRDTVVRILEGLRLKYLDGNEDRLVFQVPSSRHDLEREIDLVEEVARIHGYDRVLEQIPSMTIKPSIENPFIEFLEDLRTVVSLRGLSETVSFPFTSHEDYKALGVNPGHLFWPTVALQNPMSEKNRWLPTSLLPLLLRATQDGRARGDQGGRLFELGRGYFDSLGPKTSKAVGISDVWKGLLTPSSHVNFKAQQDLGRPQERLFLCGVLDQPRQQKSWDRQRASVDFFDGKSLFTELFKSFGLTKLEWHAPKETDAPWLHPGRSAFVAVHGSLLGFVGELHPVAATHWQWDGDAPVVFEINCDLLFRKVQQLRSSGRSLQHQFSKFPGTSRDVALLCDQTLTHSQVVATLDQFKSRRYLESWELFDCYQGPHVPDGKKSLAYRFNFRSPDKTLTDQEIDSEVGQLVHWLVERLKVTQR